jgi:peptidoglycan/xylan/chitin deacetylase (PgdA/CDA1 family)
MPAIITTPLAQIRDAHLPSGTKEGVGGYSLYYPEYVPENSNPSSFAFAEPSPSIRVTPTAVFQGPDEVLVPILLYHRIDISETDSQYYVSPQKFEEQMKLLHDWGYTTISTELLVKAISEGADLPLRPILITFDDGHLNNYTTAFPIMEKYGFTGIVYIVGGYMGTPEYMGADQIREMAKAGWEVGSHTMSHLDLTTLSPDQQYYEIVQSRKFLEAEIGVPILTFSYPFGEINRTVINMVYSTGYIAGMGLGYTHDQGTSNLFTLQRRDVNGTRDLNSFASFLPWQGDLAGLPADVSVVSLSGYSVGASSLFTGTPQIFAEPSHEIPRYRSQIELDLNTQIR